MHRPKKKSGWFWKVIVGFVVIGIIGIIINSAQRKSAIEEGDKLWEAGKKSEAVEKYKYGYDAALKRKPDLIQRIVEFEASQGNKKEATAWIEKGLRGGLKLSFQTKEAAELFGELDGLTVTVEKEDGQKTTTLHVRLDRRVSEPVLASVSTKLRRKRSSASTIFYRLPGYSSNNRAWARAVFRNGMKIKFFGMTVDEAKKLSAGIEVDSERHIVGHWLDDFATKRRITVSRQNDKAFFKKMYLDGSKGTESFAIEPVAKGFKCNRKLANDDGDYYLVTDDGKLQFGDKEGVFHTAENIEFYSLSPKQ